MITRKLTNQGNPLVDGSSNPIVGLRLVFQLVDGNYLPVAGWDRFSGNRVSPTVVEAYTDAYGEFQVPLWPTDRSSETVYWKCSVPGSDFGVIFGTIPSGTDPYYWYQFASLVPLPPPPDTVAAMFYLLDAGGSGRTATIRARFVGMADDGITPVWNLEVT